ncbi:HNH endonuclease [Luxibacter massiliensis]|uniref:HNH endonuclease n=1 Tax=Luxibacter massiliensis TaxID=2219695 RepID=UPI0013E022CD|nr:HNH endonuclease [Luxibacter massiliensis]
MNDEFKEELSDEDEFFESASLEGSILDNDSDIDDIPEDIEDDIPQGEVDATMDEIKEDVIEKNEDELDVEERSETEDVIEYQSTYEERKQQTPKEFDENGLERWSGERGESMCRLDDSEVNEILEKCNIDGIEYRDCVPDFTPVSKGNVEIQSMSDDRNGKDGNFNQADTLLAQEKGCDPRDVRDWRRENGYTWHECNDMKTCQKIPSIINSKFGHLGGVSECRKFRESEENWEDEFDEIS